MSQLVVDTASPERTRRQPSALEPETTTDEASRPRRYPAVHPVTFGTLAVVLVWVLLGWSTWSAHQRTRAEMEAAIERLALVLEAHTRQLFTTVALSFARMEIVLEHHPAAAEPINPAMRDVLHDVLSDLGSVAGVGAVDRTGDLMHGIIRAGTGTRMIKAGINVADRPYFQACQRAPMMHLHIGDPSAMPADGAEVIPVVRCYADAQGQLDHMLIAWLTPERLHTLFNAVHVGSEGAVTLMRRDGAVVAQSATAGGITTEPLTQNGVSGETPGVPMTATRAAAVPLTLAPDETLILEKVTEPDGIDRITAFRAVAGLPLLVAVGAGWTDFHAVCLRIAAINLTIGLVLTLVLAGMTALMVSRMRHERRALTRLTDSEKRLKQAQQLGRLGHFELDLNTGAMRWSDTLFDLWGKRRDAFIPTLDRFLGAVHPEDRPQVSACLNGAGNRCSFRALTDGGSVRHVVMEGEREPDEHNRLGRMFGVAQDVSRNREREFDLIAAAQQNRVLISALESVPTSIVIADAQMPDIPVIFSNRAFTQITGYGPEEVLGRNMRFLQGPETNQEDIGRLRRAIAHHQTIAVEILNYKKSGQPFWNLLTVAPVFNDDGVLAAYVGAIQDVTNERQHQERLRHFQKLEALGQLAGGIAHELNNLLQPVMTFSSLTLKSLPKGTRESEYQANILDSSRRAREIIRNILTFAHGGEPTAELADVRLATRAAVRFARDLLPATISIHESCGNDPVPAFFNWTEFSQVFVNLLTNAADAMEQQGTITVHLEVREIADREAESLSVTPGVFAVATVTDTGRGMDKVTLGRIFEPFFTTKPVGQGTGLGLAIVYGIVRRWQGAISAESELGQGTTFRVCIPVADKAAT